MEINRLRRELPDSGLTLSYFDLGPIDQAQLRDAVYTEMLMTGACLATAVSVVGKTWGVHDTFYVIEYLRAEPPSDVREARGSQQAHF